jgi:phosphoribosyl-AMP cyclohydrolase
MMRASPRLSPQGNQQDIENGMVLMPKFDSSGLITAVTVDATTNDILMVAHMNADALAKTIETGQAWYGSRSRKALWLKGETSGQIQTVVELRTDCDQDAILLKVTAGGDGGACHVGYRSCFYRVLEKTADGAFRLTIRES